MLRSLIVASACWAATATVARASDCSCASDSPSTLAVEADSAHGRHLKLVFDQNPVTEATAAATLCSQPGGVVTQARLWMPDMGHGSSPTHLKSLTPTCTAIEHIRFVMGGTWQVQIQFDDGDQGNLDVAVQ